MKRSIKDYKFYFKSILLIFGLNGLIYFLIKLLISDYNLISLPIDGKIPFIQEFIYIYMIWYPFLIVSYFFLFKYNKDKYIRSIITICLSLPVLYLCFILYPTTVSRPVVDSYNSITTFITYTVFKVDTPVNCFPSGHCLLCFILLFSVLFDEKLTKCFRVICIFINILIIISTLFTKQHVIIDVIGAFVLAFIMYYIISNLSRLDGIKNKLKRRI